MRYGVAACVFLTLLAGALCTRPAGAVKPFFEQFKALYLKPNTKDYTVQVFNAGVEKKACGVCHRGQQAKKDFNPYGKQVSKLLSAKRDAGNPQAIVLALKKVASMKSNPEDPASPTFGQRIRQGKLPAGEIIVRAKDSSHPAQGGAKQ